MAEQSNNPTSSGGSNSNIPELSSSTPIRIGSSSSSFHGTHISTGMSQENRPVSADAFALTSSGGQQSNSMPNAPTLSAHITANTNNNNNSQITPNTHQGSAIQPLNTASGGSGGGERMTPPNSAGLRLSGAFDFKFIRRTSSKVLLPRLASSDSLSNSPGPATPGLGNWASDSRDKGEGNQTEKTSRTDSEATKLNRKESYKAQRKNYRREKKRVASELLNSLQDPAVIVLADWLKVRGTLKSWTKLWCVLKPGHLLIYKSPKTKSSHWVGTILLTSCQVIERPSKKDGFCFKLFHPLEQSIWAPRGPDKETIGAVVQPLPTTHLIFRAPSQAAGKCWMDALELSLRCSALLLRSNNMGVVQSVSVTDGSQIETQESQWSEADYEKHFNEHACEKRYARFLTPPDMEGFTSHGNSDTSNGPSRSQTPLMQQLYVTITNWERVVAHASDFNKIKKISKLVKGKSKDIADHDFSDMSSVDNSPKKNASTMYLKNPYLSIKTPMLKAISLDTNWNRNELSSSPSFSDDDNDDDVDGVKNDAEHQYDSGLPNSDIKNTGKKSAARPVSAPPFIVNIKDLDADSHNEGATAVMSEPETDSDSDAGEPPANIEEEPETPYVPVTEDFFSQTGEQVEVLGDENKSLIWILLKQVRPGMDLSKVVLPTFILEPRSFLDKLSDTYFHADILSRAVTEDDPFTRMKTVVQWYLSGFYKKPKGLKKPYNPILGETFRCYWQHPNGSRTFYIAEQVSHHPPISAFYVTNRQDGFCISCSILAKSKFYGNSTSAVLEGIAQLTLLPRGEIYTLNTPYAHCKGILMGTLSMELGGKINIDCEKTGYKTELEFKLKPMIGGSDSINSLTGKIKLGKETLANIHGHWDSEIRIKDTKTGEETVLFAATNETKQKRLKRYMVPLEAQLPNESERLWLRVSEAIANEDQIAATQEKTILEEQQRSSAKERISTLVEWVPKHFQQEPITGEWIYKYADLRPWDPRNDVRQYEFDYKVLTKTKLKAAMIRTGSVVSGTHNVHNPRKLSDSSISPDNYVIRSKSNKSYEKILKTMDLINSALVEHSRQLAAIQLKLDRMQYSPLSHMSGSSCNYRNEGSTGSVVSLMLSRGLPQSVVVKTSIYFFVGLILLVFLKWLLKEN